MKNFIKDKIFTCTKCGNKSLVPIEENITGIDYHDLFICEECASELYAEPQLDCSVKFVESDNFF